uniref:hypothetical protein n=1 Tax=uncultured Lutibacter sp. TaxID=437739 RepID=UPI00345DDF5D
YLKLNPTFCRVFLIHYFYIMKKQLFRLLAKINKIILPSFSKKRLNMAKAKKWQMAIIGWRYFVTKNSL